MVTIGIFDSGIGGLTIARAISDLLPNEKILYVGDTAHSPWGDKSKSQIIHYSKNLTRFLVNNNCDFVVVACNTASCLALDAVKTEFPNIKLFNVIDPIINYLQQLKLDQFNDVGIIGTKQTIKSQTYQKSLAEVQLHQLGTKNHLRIQSLATPLLVPLIEEGWNNHAACNLVIAEYLSNLDLRDQSILILGCTHYPLIKNNIESYYLHLNKKIKIIDSTKLIAKAIQRFIMKKNINLLPSTEKINILGHCDNADNINRASASNHFYCTSNNEFFAEVAKQFFATVKLSFLPLWQQEK